MDEYIYSLPPPPPPKRQYVGEEQEKSKKTRDSSFEYLNDNESSDQVLIETMKKASENIDEWIAQRRKNWPTNKRTEERIQEKSATLESKEKPTVRPSRPCKYFALNGSCRMGEKCKFSHQKIYKRFEGPSKGSLFKKLVQADMRAENERILEMILGFDEKGWLE